MNFRGFILSVIVHLLLDWTTRGLSVQHLNDEIHLSAYPAKAALWDVQISLFTNSFFEHAEGPTLHLSLAPQQGH